MFPSPCVLVVGEKARDLLVALLWLLFFKFLFFLWESFFCSVFISYSTQSPVCGGNTASVLFVVLHRRYHVEWTLLQLFLRPLPNTGYWLTSFLVFLYFSKRSTFTLKIYSSISFSCSVRLQVQHSYLPLVVPTDQFIVGNTSWPILTCFNLLIQLMPIIFLFWS